MTQVGQKASGLACPAFAQCGGCSLLDVPYSEQLARKDAKMAELFAPLLAENPQAHLLPTLGMDDPRHFRNKVASPFVAGKRGPNGGREILTGMYAPGTHRVISTEGCVIENEQAQQVVAALVPLMKRYKLAPYDEDSGRGFLRHVVVRMGHTSGEVLVTLVTNGEEFPASRNFCRDLVKKCPFVTSVVQNINTARTNVILGQREKRLYGPGFILDSLCGLSFRISSQSFYQVNGTQTQVLYEKAIELAELDGTETVIDAYCGTGTIGLVAAARGAREVIGVDAVESSIADARQNARHNGIDNARFVVADAGDFMKEYAAECDSKRDIRMGEGAVDVVFIDPPRAGCSPEFLEALCALAPRRLVYISCNPETQVRDLTYVLEHGYRLQTVQPVDMFPHTPHIESVAVCINAR